MNEQIDYVDEKYREFYEIIQPCRECRSTNIKIGTVKRPDKEKDFYCKCSNCGRQAGLWFSINAARSAWNQWNEPTSLL